MLQLFAFIIICNINLHNGKDLDECLDSNYHKSKPGREDALHQLCTPWKDHACCTSDTTHLIPGGQMYNLNFDHCNQLNPVYKPMSEKCKYRFSQDLCFYECEPNLGPWIQKVNMRLRKERAFQVPLCKDDCDAWYADCEEDYTCADNWITGFATKNGRAQCRNTDTAKCRTFKEVFKNASNFCEQVWDHSWVYTPNEEPCMRIWFNGTAGNPNRRVAEMKIREQALGEAARSLSQTIVAMVLTIIVTIFVCH